MSAHQDPDVSAHRDPDPSPADSTHADPSPANSTCADPSPEVALLLRAHSEQRWLSREVIPVVRQLETGDRLPEEQLPAALAYLEVMWAEAVLLAHEADAALRKLDAFTGAEAAARGEVGHTPLATRARRYQAAVVTLREAVARHVAALLAAPATTPILPPAARAAGRRATPTPAPRTR